MEGSSPARWKASLLAALLPAILATLINAPKPVHVDDACFYLYAQQVVRHPTDPLGFQVMADQVPQPATQILAPPVVPYWFAAGIGLFGERPWAWKLWFLPFVLLFTASLHWLLRRFARGMEIPLTWMTLFSPAFLPGINLMLDVPALGLSLFSLCLFLHAGDRGSLKLALLAGVVAGVAAETKYTALIAPTVMAAVGWFRRRPASGVLALAVAGSMFCAWEGMAWIRYGNCQFLHSMSHFPSTPKSQVVVSAFSYLGGLGAALLLLALLVQKGRALLLLPAAALVCLAAFPGWGFLPGKAAMNLDDRVLDVLGLPAAGLLFGLAGAGLLAAGIGLALRMGVRRAAPGASRALPTSRLADRVLLVWLALEIVGCLALSPFMASRRVMPLLVVLTLVLGRFAALVLADRQRKVHVPILAGFSILLGLVYFAVDCRDASAQKEGVERAARFIEDQKGAGGVWYAGHWGFQYYAERERMAPIIPGTSTIRRGDLLVIPELRIVQQKIAVNRAQLEPIHLLEVEDGIPFHTVPAYYGGRAPIERRKGARLSIRIYRAIEDFVAQRG